MADGFGCAKCKKFCSPQKVHSQNSEMMRERELPSTLNFAIISLKFCFYTIFEKISSFNAQRE